MMIAEFDDEWDEIDNLIAMAWLFTSPTGKLGPKMVRLVVRSTHVEIWTQPHTKKKL